MKDALFKAMLRIKVTKALVYDILVKQLFCRKITIKKYYMICVIIASFHVYDLIPDICYRISLASVDNGWVLEQKIILYNFFFQKRLFSSEIKQGYFKWWSR